LRIQNQKGDQNKKKHHFTGGGTKNGLAPDEDSPYEFRGVLLTGGGMNRGIAVGGAAFFSKGGGVNSGGGSFSLRGGGVNIGGNIFELSGNFGGANVGGGKNTTSGPF